MPLKLWDPKQACRLLGWVLDLLVSRHLFRFKERRFKKTRGTSKKGPPPKLLDVTTALLIVREPKPHGPFRALTA